MAKLDDLLALQTPQSEGPEHDEMLFIVIHQVYELWFKQLRHELGAVQRALETGDTDLALHLLNRVLKILKTLVAQVDSAYGGKTGVDLPQGKNYAGVYHQPAAVLADPAALATLPPEELAAGWAEVVKTALIAGGVDLSEVAGLPLWVTPWWSGAEQTDVGMVRSAVTAATQGQFARFDVTVRLPTATREDIGAIRKIMLPLKDGTLLPLSAIADVSAIGGALIPQMVERGYDRDYAPPPETLPGAPLNPWTIPNAIGFARLALVPVFLAVGLSSGDGRSGLAFALFAFIVIGVFLIADPAFLAAEDEDQVGSRRA